MEINNNWRDGLREEGVATLGIYWLEEIAE
jgi:hypothetical protein